MGCLGVGMHHAGFEVLLRNDCNPNMLKLAKQISDVPTLLGNLNDDSVLAQACQLAPQAGILTAGVACQPYSRLEMVWRRQTAGQPHSQEHSGLDSWAVTV